jgi:hypothetical protein
MIGKIEIELTDVDEEQMKKFHEIFLALIKSGGLSGVKGGKTILHFDEAGTFMGVELDYWPWRKRKEEV